MQFTPNKCERYISSLRLYAQRRYLKYGINEKNIKMLKKIFIFGLINNSDYKQSTNIPQFCDTVLGSILVELIKKGHYFTSEIVGSGIKNVNRNLLLAILCEVALGISKKKGKITVITQKNGIIIKADCLINSKTIENISKKTKISILKIKREQTTALFISENDTYNKPSKVPEEWEYLTDKLSNIKIMLEVVPHKCFLSDFPQPSYRQPPPT